MQHMIALAVIQTVGSALPLLRVPHIRSMGLGLVRGCVPAWDRKSIRRTCSTCSLVVVWEEVCAYFVSNSGPFGGANVFTFGGPGIRTQYYRPGGTARGRQAQGQRQAQNNQTGMWFQMLPILILLALSLVSYIPSLFSVQDPDFRWRPTTVHRAHRTTFDRGVSYYVDPVSFARHPFVTSTTTSSRRGGTVQRFSKGKNSPELLSFERRVEEAWMKELYRQCEHAQEYKRRRLVDAQGFFGFGVRQTTTNFRATKPRLPRFRLKCTRAANSSTACSTFVSK